MPPTLRTRVTRSSPLTKKPSTTKKKSTPAAKKATVPATKTTPVTTTRTAVPKRRVGSTDMRGARERAANSDKPFHVIKVWPRKFRDGHRGLEYLIGRDEVEHVVPHLAVDKMGFREVVDQWHESKPEMTPLQRKCAI
ncbi:hypothetical protein CspHIS471_0601370 [Cutaneotrichosporon sp. HIS471]|nr:hypothetical protein CspHIS471_0601370 [Cutaneotrichosporon sp. HIS471]